MKVLLSLLLVLLGLAGLGHGAYEYSKEELQSLKGKKCTNLDQVKANVNFVNAYKDPYPPLWYDTQIVKDKDCYVVFPSETDKSTYELQNLTPEEAETNYGTGRAFLSHKGGCGVCSQLDDLAVYIEKTDLTTPVRRCTLLMIKPWTISCLKKLGFTEDCAMIWYWNTANTKKPAFKGGCFGVCVANIFTPNNQPVGTYNPCKPTKEIRAREMHNMGGDHAALENVNVDIDPLTSSSSGHGCLPCASGCQGCCLPSWTEKEDGLCKNTINGHPACINEQWQNGPYRMNPCLQCDECRSGPIFQKVAGRTRRASGIISAIGRPGVTEIVHNYALP